MNNRVKSTVIQLGFLILICISAFPLKGDESLTLYQKFQLAAKNNTSTQKNNIKFVFGAITEHYKEIYSTLWQLYVGGSENEQRWASIILAQTAFSNDYPVWEWHDITESEFNKFFDGFLIKKYQTSNSNDDQEAAIVLLLQRPTRKAQDFAEKHATKEQKEMVRDQRREALEYINK